jgi:murein L,D-transpeptidase YafK
MKHQKIAVTGIILFIAIYFIYSFTNSSFLEAQLKFKRVKEAQTHSSKNIKSRLTELKISESELRILMVAYKKEKKLIVYTKNSNHPFSIFREYDICAQSGSLGPKFQSGDNQTPEGFYFIDRFNPTSNFYLSLGINYPNAADKKRSKAKNLGGDIFIHGDCVSIGCLAMTDNTIKELYMLNVLAKNAGQNQIPVILAPFKFSNTTNMNFTKNIEFAAYQEYFELWKSINVGIEIFLKDKKQPLIASDNNGNYQFN